MKRIIAFVLGAVVCISAAAQSWDEALYLVENEYSGTARGVAMGNALTAIGGDIGSVVFNPAGSAVAAYTQFSITPGLTLAVSNASGSFAENYREGTYTPRGFGDHINSSYARMKMPNLGFVIHLDTGRRSGWKSTSFGFVVNSTGNYTQRFNASGENELTSYAASLASSATGYSASALSGGDWFSENTPEWVDRVGYMSGMFNGLPDVANGYIALSEVRSSTTGDCFIPAPLKQNYGVQRTGYKADIILNFAANYADRLYLGANLGITTLNYGMAEYWQEGPANADEFAPISYTDGTSATFQQLRMKRSYKLRGSGVYLKVGALWRPVAGLRIGAAIQTPTFLDMVSRNAFSGEVSLGGKSTSPYNSPEDEWGYALVNPFRYNFGLAYSIGNFAVVSADYELVNYRRMRYTTASNDFGGIPAYMSDANLDIKDVLGCSHQVRAGVEVKPTPALALRAGFNYATGAQRNFIDYYLDQNDNVQVELTALDSQQRRAQSRTSVSVGAGYSFGSFFLDAAFRARFVPKEYITPYVYYAFDTSYTDKYVDWDVEVPEIMVQSHLFDAMLTLGWRF